MHQRSYQLADAKEVLEWSELRHGASTKCTARWEAGCRGLGARPLWIARRAAATGSVGGLIGKLKVSFADTQPILTTLLPFLSVMPGRPSHNQIEEAVIHHINEHSQKLDAHRHGQREAHHEPERREWC